MLVGRAGTLPSWEQEIIEEIAAERGVDPVGLAAVRLTENGGPGREFGVLVLPDGSPPPTDYRGQASWAARSLRASEDRYRSQTGQEARTSTGRYTDEFLRFFSARYAPVGAANDPSGLNRYHADNLVAAYEGSRLG